MLINCPHCQTGLDISPDHFGQTVQCPACQGRLAVNPPEETAAPTTPGTAPKPDRKGWQEKDHANPNFGNGLGLAIGITVLFLLAMLPIRHTTMGAIFLDRGWVNYAETFLFFWGLCILLMKWRMNQRQERAALLDLFPQRIGREINRSTVGEFIDNIYKVPPALRDSIIVNRIRKALELFEARPNNAEVATFLNTQSDLDANRSEGSYALIKVFLWAIPILGFIGTVIGLSAAVGALDMGDNSDPESLKSAINSLTGGLGLAFDTTLLGLILSILLSFPMAAVRKREDETLTIIDAFCNEKVLPKLNDRHQSTTDGLLQQADSIPGLVSSLALAHETFLQNLNESTIQLKESGRLLKEGLDAHRATLEKSFTEAVTKLSDTSSGIFLKADRELNKTFETIASGIDVMNRALRDLGENQLPNPAGKKNAASSAAEPAPPAMARRRNRDEGGLSLFPFMSILAGLVGILTLLISILSRQKEPEKPQEDPAAAARATEKRQLDSKARQLERELAALAERIQKERAGQQKIIDLRDRRIVLQDELAGLKKSAGSSDAELQKIIELLRREITALEKDKPVLVRRVQELEKLIKARKEAPEPPKSVQVRPGGSGLHRAANVFFVECHSTGITLIRKGQEPLRIGTNSIANSVDYRRFLAAIKEERDPMVLFLIRKAGHPSYLWAAAEASKRFQLRIGKLPLPNDGPLDLSLFD